MQETIALILQIFLIVIAIAVVLHKENFTIIIYIASFGLIAAILYTLNQAPDVAIAEVAIGSAIIPLIYVVSISRQREYIILDRVNHNRYDLDEQNIILYEKLSEFVLKHDLKMNVCADMEGYDELITKELNVDLIISYNDETKKFELKGKSSSILVKQLKETCNVLDFVDVIFLKEGEHND